MKYRIFGAIAVLGILITAFGAWARILHKPSANVFVTIGLCAEGIGLAALAWFVFGYLRKKSR